MKISLESDRSLATLAPKKVNASTVVMPIDDAVSRHASEVYWSWRSAFDRDPNATPLQHPDVVLADMSAVSGKSPLNPVVVCEDLGSDKSAFAILIPKTVRASQMGAVGLDWKLQGLRLAGGRILGSTNSSDQQRRILQCAARYATESNADFLLIEDLDVATSLYPAVQSHEDHGCLLFVTHDFQPRHYIDFPETEAEYMNSFSSHCRKLFRRAIKKCSNARLERITRVDQVADFLEAAHEVSSQSWQSHQFGMRVRNDESELKQLTTLAIHGLLRSYVYWIDDKPAAFAVGNQHGSCFRYEETGFNAGFRHYSPGRTMLLEILSDLQKHDPVRIFDFGFGDAEYKQQFTNRESRSGTVWLVPPGLRARLMLSHLNVCRQFRSAVYTQIKRSGLGTMVRQWMRSPIPVSAAAMIHESDEASFGAVN